MSVLALGRKFKTYTQWFDARIKDYYLERRYPAFGRLVQVMWVQAAKERCDAVMVFNATGEAGVFGFIKSAH